MEKNKLLVIGNTATLVIMLLANFVASAGVFSTVSVAEVSNKYNTLFTPAGYAFSIWSFLFLLAIGFTTYQWKLLKRPNSGDYITKTGYWFMISNVANASWLYFWTHEVLGLSVLVILVLLTSLIVLTRKLRLELDDEGVQIIFFIWWPFSFYLGWVMVATIANVAAWLVSIGWRGGEIGEVAWTNIMIVMATILYLLLIYFRNLRECALVGIWAFIAIATKQWTHHNIISITAITASSILLIATAAHAYKNRHSNPLKKIKNGEWK